MSNNLALKRPAYQSSVKEGKPEVANDGVNNLELGAGAFTSTNTLSNQWWRVDLGSISLIEELVVFNPNDPGMLLIILFGFVYGLIFSLSNSRSNFE